MSTQRATRTRFLNGVRQFNKYFFNRLILPLAHRGIGPFSIVTHIGRRSQRLYRTPVLATYMADKIIIPLSYGDRVDWLRNVLNQGECKIRYKGEDIIAQDPVILKKDDALDMLPENRRNLFARYDIEKFVGLSRVV